MIQRLDFEKPITDLEEKIAEYKEKSVQEGKSFSGEIEKIERKIIKLRAHLFEKLSPWQRTLLARHPNRPYTLDYIQLMMTDFIELHGDRLFGEDKAMVGGMARLDEHTVMVIGHQKGRLTKEKLARNFGMPHPEGYRKALRLMKLAEKFAKPIITFIDTPGAYPGIGAEERGQAEAIANNLKEMAQLKVPIISVVIGEGGSGGALAIGVGNRVLMLQYAIYSVISPEGCAAILWGDNSKAETAAEAMKLTSSDLYRMSVIDEVVEEPPGGAHRDPKAMAQALKKALKRHLYQLALLSPEELQAQRWDKYSHMGVALE